MTNTEKRLSKLEQRRQPEQQVILVQQGAGFVDQGGHLHSAEAVGGYLQKGYPATVIGFADMALPAGWQPDGRVTMDWGD